MVDPPSSDFGRDKESIVERLGRNGNINTRSQSFQPAAIVAGAVKDCVDVERFVDDREEYSVRKTICEHAPDIAVAMNNAK